MHDDVKRNQRIQTLGAPLLTFKNPLCAKCNNEWTQAHDKAWETLSAALRQRCPTLHEGGHVRVNKIFRYDTRRHMLAVHLYFVKLFLGTIVEGNANFDRAPFQRAILDNKAMPNIYLKVGLLDGLDDRVVASGSNFEVQYYKADNRPAFASWLYEPGSGIAVMVMFAAHGEVRNGLDGAWHPKLATTRLRIADFNR